MPYETPEIKSAILPVNPDGIPAELRGRPQWVLWKQETRGNDPKPTKVPYRADGRGRASSTDPATWDTFEQALAVYHRGGYDGIGFVLHRAENATGPGLVGIDLDDVRNPETGELQPWAAETVQGLASYAEVSPSGTGVHSFVYGTLPFTGKKNGPVEMYATSRYLCVTGYRLDGVPATIEHRQAELDRLRVEVFGETKERVEEKIPQPFRPASPGRPDVIKRAIAYLAKCDPAVSGQCGHNDTYWPARVVCWGFNLGADAGFDVLWEHFNDRCVPPWSEKELRHKCQQADTKPFDKPRGWLLAERRDAPDDGVNLAGIDRQVKATADVGFATAGCKTEEATTTLRAQPCAGPTDPGPFPAELLQVQGFIGEVVSYAEATAHRPQPVLALAAAICLQATLAARKVSDEQDGRTNVYAVGVGPSGSGKDHARTVNKKTLYAAGAEQLAGPEELASAAGMITALDAQPACLFQLDEFGRVLRTMGDPKQAPHLYALATLLLKLYTSAGTPYRAGGYADPKRNKLLYQPCAVVYGTTVPQSLFESLTAESITDGLMARLLIFEAEAEVPELREPRPCDVPDNIVATARAWWALEAGGNLASVNPRPFTAASTDEARATFRALALEADRQRRALGEPLGSLWTRTAEKARKLALVHACSRAIPPTEIDGAAARWGCALSRYLTQRLVFLASQWVSDGQHDAKRRRVLRAIQAAKAHGLTRAALTRKTQSLSNRERDEAIDALSDSEEIAVVRVPGTGRTASVYYAAEFAPNGGLPTHTYHLSKEPHAKAHGWGKGE